ncbi:hypothetical protein CC79DRAFT_1396394 [Sarocladium strictum]
MLHPGIFKLAGQQLDWNTTFGAEVVRPLLSTLQIRRTMTTPTRLPDGQMSYPSDGIQPSTVIVQEVSYQKDSPYAEILQSYCKEMMKKLFVQSEDPENPDFAGGDDGAVRREGGSEPRLNFDVHREATLDAHDPRNKELFDNRKAVFYGPVEKTNKFIKKVRTSNKSRTESAKKRQKVNAQKDPDTRPVVGTEHLRELLEKDTTGGLQFAYFQTREGKNTAPPLTRDQWMRWQPAVSPTMIRCLQLLDHFDGGREL